MKRLILFDIDGTLVLTGGAGLRAMNRACEDLVGHGHALEGIPLAGRTDWIILQDAAARIGRTLDAGLMHELRGRYVQHLQEEIELPGRGVKAVMPGIRQLLEALAPRPDVALGLLTGNFVEGARIKLAHFGLWQYFRCGAYGDDASDRNALVPVAIARARACGAADVPPGDVIVVGDTPYDVACALAAGAVPVGVATGSSTVDALRASGAGIVFQDLGDTQAFLDLLSGGSSTSGPALTPRV
ncbi:MAG TPA: HAD family hydrolase [Vicinamibacterales bacterium]|nr:HAD family hydrolase [Vicinamibacterales bacterium]